jgi:hypothetical protein
MERIKANAKKVAPKGSFMRRPFLERRIFIKLPGRSIASLLIALSIFPALAIYRSLAPSPWLLAGSRRARNAV